jgi:hypothetical protein
LALGLAAVVAASLAGVAQPVLAVRQVPAGVELSWAANAGAYVAETTPSLATGTVWDRVNQPVTTVGDRRVFVVPAGDATRFFRLRAETPTLLTVVWTSPAAGEGAVSVTRESVFRLSAPLAAGVVVNGERLYAQAAGRRLLARPELSGDRQTVNLFYLENLPGGARVEVTLDGTGWTGASGEPADLDGDGLPGGTAVLRFETANTAPLANTAITGRVLASEPGPGGADVPLPGVTITVDGREESLRTVTDAQGNFRLQPCPAGRFFVNVDGRTSPLSQWPNGAYYPLLGKGWEAVAGRTNNLAGGTGIVYLPLIAAGTLQPVSATEETRVTFPPAVIQQNPALAGVEIVVPPNGLFADNGARGGLVGMAPVASDRLPEPLPAGLNHAIDISIQTSGPQNFDWPVPAKFPNLPDPVTGEKLPPGAKTALWSFNHDTGRWEMQGPMTVTPDGNFVVTDPGVGIRQPGWHGASPGSPGGGGPGDGGGCPGGGGGGLLAEGTSGGGGNCDCPEEPADAKKKAQECFSRAAECALKCYEDCGEPGRPEGWLDVLSKGKDCAEAARCSLKCKEDGEKCKDHWDKCVLGGGGFLRRLHGRGPELHEVFEDNPATIFARQALEEMALHAGRWFELEALLNKAPTYEQLSPQDKARVQQLNNELRELYRGKSPAAYYAAKERRLVQLVLTSPFADSIYPPVRGYYALEDLASGLVRRGRTEPRGYLNNLILRPNNPYRIRLLLGPTLTYHEAFFTSADAGVETPIPFGPVRALSATDADGDRIPAEAEFVLGTRDDRADTDADGADDRQELLNDSNPLDGQPPANGVIAALDTPGEAEDVAIQDALALVADRAAGVTVVSLANPLQPVLLQQVNTPGDTFAVAFAGNLGVAADGNGGLVILDLIQPASPAVVAQLALGGEARAVAVDAGLAFVGLGNGQLVAVDVLTGEQLSRITLPGGPAIEDVAVKEGVVWVWAAGRLHALNVFEGQLEWLAAADSGRGGGQLGRRMRLSLAGDLAYGAFPRGVAAFDIANPASPALKQVHNTPQFGWKQLVPVMPGLGVAADGTSPLGDEPQDLSLYRLGEDGTELNFLGSFVTPGVSRALTVNGGLAFVADGPAGLQVVNFAPADTAGVPPTLTLQTSFPLDPPRIESGQPGRLVALADDDGMVRWVEFYRDGELVKRARNWPFDYRFTAPELTPATTNLVLGVRAVDMAGNASALITLDVALLPDSTPPRVTTLFPREGVVLDTLTRLLARFNEPLDFLSITPARVRLVSAGPDQAFDNDDDQPVAGLVDYSAASMAAQLELDQPLPPGRYRFEVDGLRDVAGNAQVGTAVSRFWVAPGGPEGDADGDGLANAEEGNALTNPFAEDTDGDGWADEVEVNDGSDPRDPASRPRQFFAARPPVAVGLVPAAEDTPAGPFLALPPVAVGLGPASEEAPPGPFVARPPVQLQLAPASEATTAGPFLARPPVTLKRN